MTADDTASREDAELERHREAFLSGDLGGLEGDECPDSERLWLAVEGNLGRKEMRVLLDHVIDCSACATQWALARELSTVQPRERATAARAERWRLLLQTVAVGLALAIAGWLLLPRLLEDRDAPQVERGGEDSAIESLVARDGVLPRDNCLLRWTGPEGARYDIEVTTEGLQPIARARGLTSPEYKVPAEALAELPPTTRLYWQVRIVDPPELVASSDPFSFLLAETSRP